MALTLARKPLSRLHLSISNVTLVLSLVTAAGTASAQQATATAEKPSAAVLVPGTRPMFATASIAPAFGLSSNAATQLKLSQSFGYHFTGDGSGFAIGGELQESLGGSAFAFQVGPKAWYDIQVSDRLGLYLAPSFMLGLAYGSASQSYYGYDYGSIAGVAFNMQIGFEAKLVIGDRGLVFFRPVTIDIGVGSQVAVRYDLVFGGGATF